MILDEIVARRREDVARAKRDIALEDLQQEALYAEPRRGFRRALEALPRAVIAEVKKASPSKGLIRADFDPVAIARAYAANGAAAISVLTEEHYFLGSPDDLRRVRRAVDVPLLRKDFVFDPYQIYEARAWGADAVLLIVAMLDDAQLGLLHGVTLDVGLDALVEVHDAREFERAQRAGATLIGINNRDLRTFVTTLATTEALAAARRPGELLISESGIDSHDDVVRLERCGVHAFLVGESLMRATDPGQKLAGLLRAGSGSASPSP